MVADCDLYTNTMPQLVGMSLILCADTLFQVLLASMLHCTETRPEKTNMSVTSDVHLQMLPFLCSNIPNNNNNVASKEHNHLHPPIAKYKYLMQQQGGIKLSVIINTGATLANNIIQEAQHEEE